MAQIGILPFKATKLAAESQENYLRYMDELYDDKVEEFRQGLHGDQGMDLMGQLVRSKLGEQQQANGRVSGSANAKAPKTTLTKEEIVGNAFIMMVAGHETTANAMHFTLIELATNPASQRHLQKDIDAILGGADPWTWNYESKVNPMMGSMIGACMNETLRTMPPVVEIPKKVVGPEGQIVTLDGEKHLLPVNAMVTLVAVAVHRNPRYWPSRPSKITGGADDINDYVPERWFRTTDSKSKASEDDSTDAEDFGGYSGRDTSEQLFRPVRGAYIPFSEGARSCLGRRIAQVEIIAALAVIFRDYSMELAVDEWATDDELAGMGREDRARLYRTAQDACRKKLETARSILTLKLHGTHVPLRIVKRGEERFVNFVDA
jgi:cytochrome P450